MLCRFAFASKFSGQLLYFDYLLTLYNAMFTAIPILLLATLDVDLSDDLLLSKQGYSPSFTVLCIVYPTVSMYTLQSPVYPQFQRHSTVYTTPPYYIPQSCIEIIVVVFTDMHFSLCITSLLSRDLHSLCIYIIAARMLR